MTRFAAAFLCLFALAACGADGEPIPPSMNAGLMTGPLGVEICTR